MTSFFALFLHEARVINIHLNLTDEAFPSRAFLIALHFTHTWMTSRARRSHEMMMMTITYLTRWSLFYILCYEYLSHSEGRRGRGRFLAKLWAMSAASIPTRRPFYPNLAPFSSSKRERKIYLLTANRAAVRRSRISMSMSSWMCTYVHRSITCGEEKGRCWDWCYSLCTFESY